MALILGFFLLWFGFLWVNHCGHLGPLETFLRGLCCQKIVKNSLFFKCFFENAAFGVFDAFDGCFESFASLFGRFSSTMASKIGFEKVPNIHQELN